MNLIKLIIIILLFLPPINSVYAKNEDPQARRKWIQSTLKNSEVNTPNNFVEMQENFSNSLPNAPEGYFLKSDQPSSQTWLHAGPDNIGGRTRAVEYDRTNPDIIIAGGVSGGIWRSVDGGKSWVQTSGIKEIASVTAIIQDPRPGKNNVWYCGGGEHNGNSSSSAYTAWYTGNGIYKSTDNGISWTPYGTTGDNLVDKVNYLDKIYRLAIDPTNLDEDILYVACLGTILKISENGNKFDHVIELKRYNRTATDIKITPSGTFYATISSITTAYGIDSYAGIFKSDDGIKWEQINPEFLQPSYRIIMDFAPNNENILYFLSTNIRDYSTGCDERYYECYTLCKLEIKDTNLVWTDLSSHLPYFEAKNEYNYLLTQGDYCMAIKVSPADENIVLLAGANGFISYDGFTSTDNTRWIAGYNENFSESYAYDTTKTAMERYELVQEVTKPTGGWDFHWFTFNPNNPKEVIAASDHGLHKIEDVSDATSKSWIDINNGYCTTQFYNCSINRHEAGNDFIMGGLQDNGTVANIIDNTNYFMILGGDGMKTHVTKYGSVLASTQFGTIVRLDMNKDSVTDCGFISTEIEFTLNPPFYTTYAVEPNEEKELAYATNTHIAICKDITSKNAHKEFEAHRIDNLYATCAEYSAFPNKILYVGTQNRRIIKVTNFSEEDFSYEIMPLPNYVKGRYIADIWVNPKDNNNVIAIVSNYLSLGMLESTDGCETWTDHGGNLEEFPDGSGGGHSFRCYERMVYEGDTLHLLGTSDGVFSTKTLQAGNTVWMREGANTIGKAVIEDIAVRDLDGRVVVATHGNGLFKTNYTTSVDSFNGKNLGFAVSNVYPNPASNQINFVINSDDASYVEAKILDLNGKEIATLISEEFTGTKNISYDIDNLSTGTYFIHISDGNHYITKKVNIIR